MRNSHKIWFNGVDFDIGEEFKISKGNVITHLKTSERLTVSSKRMSEIIGGDTDSLFYKAALNGFDIT